MPYKTVLYQRVAAFTRGRIEALRRPHLVWTDLGWSFASSDLPLCPAMPLLRTLPQLLRAMCGGEGSTPSGQSIIRQSAKSGIGLRHYFTRYGECTGLQGNARCQWLPLAALAGGQNETAALACFTFQPLITWLNHP